MKRIICILLACITFHFAEGKKTGEIRRKVKGSLSNSDVSRKRIALANLLAQRQQNCAQSQGCGLEQFCTTDGCDTVITMCHKIDINTFNILTNNMSDGHATFPKSQIDAVLNGANCGEHWIRCYIHEGWLTTYFRISAQPDYVNDGLDYETYYSVKLLQAINAKQINSMVLYRGTQITPLTYITPFIVNYEDGTTEYFDVSNDLP